MKKRNAINIALLDLTVCMLTGFLLISAEACKLSVNFLKNSIHYNAGNRYVPMSKQINHVNNESAWKLVFLLESKIKYNSFW